MKIVEGPSDAEVDALYKGAVLTIFPSIYEGWGLPVRESLSYGKICVAARNSAIIEAGDQLADGFENNSEFDLLSVLEPYFDDKTRQAREAVIADQFKEFSWNDTRKLIRDHLTS